MSDKFAHQSQSLSSPARSGVPITPHDATELTDIPRAIYIGGSGTLRVTLADDATPIDFAAVTAGQFLPIRPRRVHATGTTATGLIAIW